MSSCLTLDTAGVEGERKGLQGLQYYIHTGPSRPLQWLHPPWGTASSNKRIAFQCLTQKDTGSSEHPPLLLNYWIGKHGDLAKPNSWTLQ